MIQQLFWLLLSLLRQLLHILKSFFTTPTSITFDENNISVILQSKIAEGGFSYIYSAHDKQYPSTKQYALKRIICPDEETIVACRKEAKVHRTLGNSHENVLPLIAVKFDVAQPQTICYMLFPLVEGGSLRDEINRRNLLNDVTARHSHQNLSQPRPLTEYQVLNIFAGILQAVIHMHSAGLAHYDIKPENILLESYNSSNTPAVSDEELGVESSSTTRYNPILMDFGSARSLVVQLSNRRVVLNLTEEASRNSTVTYRAPELFEGGCRHGEQEADIDGKVDVWSCGCLLYSIMYGTSPFEMDFRHDGSVKIIECTHLGVLGGKVPVPPMNSEVGERYRSELLDLVKWILKVERTERPSIEQVLDKVEGMLGSHSTSNTWAKSNEYDGLL